MRLDQWLVAHGFADSRTRARGVIEGGYVTVDGTVVIRPASRTKAGTTVDVTGAPPMGQPGRR